MLYSRMFALKKKSTNKLAREILAPQCNKPKQAGVIYTTLLALELIKVDHVNSEGQ